MAGFQSGDSCYPTAADANMALAYTFKGQLINLGGGPAVVREVASSSNVVALYLAPVDGSPEIEHLISVDPSACILPDVADGALLGWAVAACFIAVFGIMFLARALRGETGGTYGES